MNDLVTIKIFNNSTDFHMAKAFLESAEIKSFSQGEYINQVYPLANNAIGGIQMQVAPEQAEEAVKLLIEGGFASEEEYEAPEGIKQAGKFLDWIKGLFN